MDGEDAEIMTGLMWALGQGGLSPAVPLNPGCAGHQSEDRFLNCNFVWPLPTPTHTSGWLQQLLKVLGADRGGKQIPLGIVAAGFLKPFSLVGCLDAFRNNL